MNFSVILTFLVCFFSILSTYADNSSNHGNEIYQMSDDRLIDLTCYTQNNKKVCELTSIEYIPFGEDIISHFAGFGYRDLLKEGAPDEQLLQMFGNSKLTANTNLRLSGLIDSVSKLVNSKSDKEFIKRKQEIFKKSKGLCIIQARPLSGNLEGTDYDDMKSKTIVDQGNCETHYERKDRILTYFSTGQKCKNTKTITAKTIVNYEHKTCTQLTYVGN